MTEIELSHHHKEKDDRVESYENYQLRTTTSAYQKKGFHAKYHDLVLHNLGPFMILPLTESVQAEAMCFFEYISIKHLNEYRHCQSWRETLMFFSQTVPTVRYAAIALALIHRNFLDLDSSNCMDPHQSLKNWLRRKDSLLHYNRAIQLLLDQKNGDITEITAVTLLVCYLFICFEHLAGNDVQAVKHLKGGVELSRNIDEAILNKNCIHDDAKYAGACTLICQVTKQIRRLDMQAVTFLVNWTPADIQEKFMSHLSPSNNTFRSLDQAADHLQVLVARVMRLCNTEQQMSPMGKMPPLPSYLKDTVLGQLEMWSGLFENILHQYSSYETGSETYPLVSLLRLQYTVAWILLNTCGKGREMEYDNYLPQFQQCVALAVEVAAGHERYSGSSKPTFTPEIGIVPILYIIGVKCRHPKVRREALRILQQQPIREAVWDSISAARVVERVIDIEEGGSGQEQMIQSMEQITVWQRIEALFWVHVSSRQSAARLDITYTFSAQDGMHIDSLVK